MTDRASWLARRRGGIGGSDIAAILGLSRWRTALDVWLDKRGLIEDATEEPESVMQIGRMHEPTIAALYAQRHGVTLIEPAESPIVHADRPWRRGSVDRLDDSREPVELKHVDGHLRNEWGGDGSDGVPDYYLVQGAWYASLLDADSCAFGVLFGGNRFASFRVPRDSRLEDILLEAAERFWVEHVQAGIPPAPTRRDSRTLARLHPDPSDDVADAPPELEDVIDRLLVVRGQLDELADEKDELEVAVKAAIADRRGIRSRRARIVWTPTKAHTRPAAHVAAGRRLYVTETPTS